MYKRDKKCGPIVADDNLDMTFVTKDFTLDPIPSYLEYSFVYCILVLTRNIMSNILIYREVLFIRFDPTSGPNLKCF